MCQNAVSVGKMHITQRYSDISRKKSKLLWMEQVGIQTQAGMGRMPEGNLNSLRE